MQLAVPSELWTADAFEQKGEIRLSDPRYSVSTSRSRLR